MRAKRLRLAVYALVATGLILWAGVPSLKASKLTLDVKVPSANATVDLPGTCESIGGTWQWNDPNNHDAGGKCVVDAAAILEAAVSQACANRGGTWDPQTKECTVPLTALYSDGPSLCAALGGTWDAVAARCDLCQ